MSFFQTQITFTPEEQEQFHLLQQITWLARKNWNVFAVFQVYRLERTYSERLIRALSHITEGILTLLQEHPDTSYPDILTYCVQKGSQYNFLSFHSKDFWQIVLREFWKATPPPYCMRRSFEESVSLLTGYTRPASSKKAEKITQQTFPPETETRTTKKTARIRTRKALKRI